MASNILFRVTRGVAVVVAIVVTHFVIVWLFQHMQVRVPDMGPVFATIMVDEDAESERDKQSQAPAVAPEPPSPSPPAQAVNQASRKAPAVPEREKPATTSDADATEKPQS